MSRTIAIEAARALLDDGRYPEVMARRVAIPTASQALASGPHLDAYRHSLGRHRSSISP